MLSSLWRRISVSSRIALSGSLVLVLVIAILLYSVIQEEVVRLRTEFALKITSDLAILVPTLTEQAILGDYSTIRQVLTPYAERPGSIGNSNGLFHRPRRLCPPAAHPPAPPRRSPAPTPRARAPRLEAAGLPGGTEAWGRAAGAAGAAKRDEREYLNIPIVAHPRVAQEKVAAVRAALLHMAHDPVGLQVLTASAALIKLDPPYGFVAATDSEYDNIRTFFKHALVNRD